MAKTKGKVPAKKPLPRSPRPRNGVWDWTKCYWGEGERVTVLNPKGANGPKPGTAGAVETAKRNRFGRINYLVRLDGRRKAEAFLLEELLDNPFWTGPPTTLLYTGGAAKKLRKEQEER